MSDSDGCIEYIDNIQNISKSLVQLYNLNKPIELNEEQNEILNYYIYKLKKLANSLNVSFNIKGFTNLVKRIVGGLAGSMSGGGEYENKLVPVNEEDDIVEVPDDQLKRVQTRFTIYDFSAIVMLLAGIVLIYLSYINFQAMTESLTGSTVEEISEEVKAQFNLALKEVKKLPINEVTFLQYFVNSISTFSCEFTRNQVTKIQNIITLTLQNAVFDFTQKVTSVCTSKLNVVSPGTLAIGGYDFGSIVNAGAQYLSAATDITGTNTCIIQTGNILVTQAFQQMNNQKDVMFQELLVKTNQIINLFVIGSRISVTSIGYISYRLISYSSYQLGFTPNRQIEPPINTQYRLKQLNKETKGGKRRTKKHRKSHKKNSRKYRRKKTHRRHKTSKK